MGVLRYLGLKLAGGTHTHISKRIKDFEIDTSHFYRTSHNAGVPSAKRKTAEQILIVFPEGSARPKVAQLRRAMVELGVEVKCPCGITDNWNGKPIQLEVDHIDGDWYNNLIDNLRFLCPNCHSQEPTNRSWRKT
jgi:hypothetical protein